MIMICGSDFDLRCASRNLVYNMAPNTKKPKSPPDLSGFEFVHLKPMSIASSRQPSSNVFSCKYGLGKAWSRFFIVNQQT